MVIDITTRYAAYAKLWSSEQANKLPEHSEFDHSITFKDPVMNRQVLGLTHGCHRTRSRPTRVMSRLAPGRVLLTSRTLLAGSAPDCISGASLGYPELVPDLVTLNSLMHGYGFHENGRTVS